MEKDKILFLKKNIDVTDLAGEKVMIDFELGKYFLVKGVGNDIWDYLKTGMSAQNIIDNLLETYDVSAEECNDQVMSFLSKLESYGFI